MLRLFGEHKILCNTWISELTMFLLLKLISLLVEKNQVFSGSKLEKLRRELAQSVKGIRLRTEGLFGGNLNLQPLNQR